MEGKSKITASPMRRRMGRILTDDLHQWIAVIRTKRRLKRAVFAGLDRDSLRPPREGHELESSVQGAVSGESRL